MRSADERAAGLRQEGLDEVVGYHACGKTSGVTGDFVLLIDELYAVLTEYGRTHRQREKVVVLHRQGVLELLLVTFEILRVDVVHNQLRQIVLRLFAEDVVVDAATVRFAERLTLHQIPAVRTAGVALLRVEIGDEAVGLLQLLDFDVFVTSDIVNFGHVGDDVLLEIRQNGALVVIQHPVSIFGSSLVGAAHLLRHPFAYIVDHKEVAGFRKVDVHLDGAVYTIHGDGVGQGQGLGLDLGRGDLRQRRDAVERMGIHFGFASRKEKHDAAKSDCNKAIVFHFCNY